MDNLNNAKEAFEKLDNEEIHSLLLTLLEGEKIDIPILISTYSDYLARFKNNAINDMRKLAEAGLTLSEKQIKKIPSMKNKNKKSLYSALAMIMLQAGYKNTDFNKELSKYIDVLDIDKQWFKDSWQLKTEKDQRQNNG